MPLNQTLTQDIDNIMNYDVPSFQNAFVKNLLPSQLNHFMNDIVKELKASFEIYDVEYNEETLKAAVITLIWTAKATQEMFPNGSNPVPDHRKNPVGYALYGMMQAFPCLVHALEAEMED